MLLGQFRSLGTVMRIVWDTGQESCEGIAESSCLARIQQTDRTDQHFQYTFYLILRLIGVYCLRIEQTQSRGRVDCILETPQYIYIFEFKLDGSADEALRQIEEKGYAQPYLADKRKIVCIGVVFSSQTRTISEWKEVR